MTREETKQAIEELKAQGFSEDEMLLTFYTMFQNDELNIEQLGSLVDLLGYELSPEFLEMSPEDQKTKGYEEVEEGESGNLSEEEIEDAKEVTPEETEETEKVEEDSQPEEKEEKTDASEDDEEKAKKLFGIKNWK